jgi:UDP-N-acetylmuramyl tripeptide synthase
MSRLAVAYAIGRVAARTSRTLGRGRGETILGRVLLTLCPDAITRLASGRDIVIVSGTNGKTTTTANLASVLSFGTGERVSTSEFGANMAAGIAAALATRPRNRLVALECDEMHLPHLEPQLKPRVVVLLNLSRDQLHRTGEVRKVASLWHSHFVQRTDPTIVIDRDDPFLEFAVLGRGNVVRVGFGGRRHPDAATCPSCARILDWSAGDYQCECGLGALPVDIEGPANLPGPARNSVLVVAAARLLGAELTDEQAAGIVDHSPDRVSNYAIADRLVPTRLAKNPESWRGALKAITADHVVLAVNARGIDGRDTSWLWDIDYSALRGRAVVCTGDRRLDVAYRLQVQGVDVQVADDFAHAVTLCGDPDDAIEAIASYTAFQDLASAQLGIRAGIGGRSS